MPKKKTEEIEEEATELEAPHELDAAELKANQILEHITSDMTFEGVQLDPGNKSHLIVAAWLVGRGGWLRK